MTLNALNGSKIEVACVRIKQFKIVNPTPFRGEPLKQINDCTFTREISRKIPYTYRYRLWGCGVSYQYLVTYVLVIAQRRFG